MARYFFHLHECGTVISDEEGRDLPHLGAARAAATIDALSVMSAEVLTGKLCLSCAIVIEDGGYNELLRLPFRDMLAISGL